MEQFRPFQQIFRELPSSWDLKIFINNLNKQMKHYEIGQEKKALELARSPCFKTTSYLNRLFEPYERGMPQAFDLYFL